MDIHLMNAQSIDISALDVAQRIALMERLWQSLATDLDLAEPPAWHDAELEARAKEWLVRDEIAEDWAKVREELRDDLP